ncbi:MAG: 4-hydroxy-tetrahydrodipicolinate synthase [Oscillospiraceae bacterium]|nr:4-hydroxy-tetrahydrodipicolinate synthase [Oscillospiraceae bacterium]
MKTPLFTGSGAAICTPFTADDRINFDKLAELIDFQIENGTTAIIICGTTGETSTQTLEEHIETVDFCVKHVAGRVKVIAGSGSNDTRAALCLSQEAEKSGADGLLVVTPYYNKATQRGLADHFFHIADRVNLPIVLYNVPSRTGVGFTADTYKTLSKHPLINGTKEASGDFSLLAQTIAACGDDLHIWSGNDDHTVPMLALGARGLISVAANVIPRQMAEMCDAALAGDFKRAAAIQLQYSALLDGLFMEVNPIPVKTAMNLMGMDVGHLRMPLCEMDPGNLAKLKAIMVDAGLSLTQ